MALLNSSPTLQYSEVSVAQSIVLPLAILKNDSEGLPEFITSTVDVRGGKKHFQTFTFFLNVLIYDSWGVPLKKKKEWSQMENKIKATLTNIK